MNKLLLLLFFTFSFYFAQAQNIMISEIVDPNDNASCRYVEIFCDGPMPCNLAGYDLVRWTNANSDPTESTAIDLTSLGTLAVNETAIIANDGADFAICYGFAPDISASTGGPADSNGDDQIAIRDASDMIVDIFGVPGEDGTGTCHEFEDGRAIRNAGVAGPSAVWDESEWTVFADSDVSGCTSHTNDPQDVVDMDPGVSLLPVEFVKVEVEKSNRGNVLNWTTATEVNNEKFVVERSSDGRDFIELTSVKGQGNSTELIDYEFVDDNPVNGMNFYRLKQMDFDGKFEYSTVVSIRNNNTEDVKVYPTNVMDVINVELSDKGEIAIYSVTGQLLMNKLLTEGNSEINLSGLSAGIYFIAIETNANVVTQQIVKQ